MPQYFVENWITETKNQLMLQTTNNGIRVGRMISLKRLALALLLMSLTGRLIAETAINTDLTVDTTWSPGGSPYLVGNAVGVSTGVTLTITPGTEVVIDGPYSLTSRGSVQATGATFLGTGTLVAGSQGGSGELSISGSYVEPSISYQTGGSGNISGSEIVRTLVTNSGQVSVSNSTLSAISLWGAATVTNNTMSNLL